MAIEIERKFLVDDETWRQAAHKSARMRQGYVNDAVAVAEGRERCSVRVRQVGDAAMLNFKSREIGPSRQEFEYPIPLADAEALLALCVGGLIDKIRHYVQFSGDLWEIDEFLGDNAGLIVAEIELPAEDHSFQTPSWLGPEVTRQSRYYNMALAERPYRHWTNEEKAEC
jgi:adenylate cyclase